MSGHGHDDADTAHDEHQESATSSDDFPADEPRSPGWLPLLGGALFLAGIFALVVFSGDDPPAGATEAVVAPAPSPGAVNGDPAQRPAMRLPPGVQLPGTHAAVPSQP